jgi:hypothetical protein
MGNISINYYDMSLIKENSDYVKLSDFNNIMIDSGGSFLKENQLMVFNFSGMEILIGYNLYVSGIFSFDRGDWETPPYSECHIDEVDIEIDNVFINGYEVELSEDIIFILKKIIDKNL